MNSRISVPYQPFLYAGFSGLSTARADVALENQQAQPIVAVENLYCSPKGYISNEPGLTRLKPEEGSYISHIRQVNPLDDTIIYAAREAGGTSLRCVGSSAAAVTVWPRDARVASAIFEGWPVFAAGQQTLKTFDGAVFRDVASDAVQGGKYLAVVSNRLVVAGFSGSRANELAISRVNAGRIHYTDENPADPSVLKAVRLNVSNLLNSADMIRGIAEYETGKLAIFTNDRVLVYLTDQDYTKWSIDPSVVVRVGTISHRSIVQCGRELYFCGRGGVYSLRRSILSNSQASYAIPMSEDITELYQSLVSQVPVTSEISSYFSEVDGRLHIFFPINERLAYRLSATLSPPGSEQDPTVTRWSLSTYAGQTCGDYLAGKSVVGTVAGVQRVSPWYSDDGIRGNGFADFPVLWHKDFFQPKKTHAIVLYASGVGKVFLECWDETMRSLGPAVEFELPDKDQNDYYGVPIQRQFIRQFQHQYLGLRIRLRIESKKSVRVFGIGVLVKE